MGIWIYLQICILAAKSFGNPDTVHRYEVVTFEIVKHRSKRAVLADAETDLEVAFVAFGTEFHFLLNTDLHFPDIRSDVRFYEGVLKDRRSNVLCFLLDSSLTAVVKTEDGFFYVESARHFLDDVGFGPQEIAVYRYADHDWLVLARHADNLHDILFTASDASGLDVETLTEDAFCEIEMVADHTIYEHFGKDEARITANLYLHGKFADAVFRDTNFGWKNRTGRLRIAVANISLYRSENDTNYPMVDATSLHQYLLLFSLRNQEPRFCLSLGLLYRRFEGTTIGEAFVPKRSPWNPNRAVGGICDSRTAGFDGRASSLNTGVLNLQSSSGTRHPLATTLVAFAHEVAHGFGAEHDPDKEGHMCTPKGNPFMMYPSADGIQSSKNVRQLSPCSRAKIRDTVGWKGACFVKGRAECGNGVREGKEACDCGTHVTCSTVDPCCHPSDAKPSWKGCTLRHRCSPQEHLCCSFNCKTVRAKGTVCYRDNALCMLSLCDGRKPACPAPSRLDTGGCQNLPACTCENNHTAECCLHDGHCVPAAETGRNQSDCNFGKYLCDEEGNCDEDGHRYSPLTTHILLGFSLVLCLGMIVVLLILYCKNSDPP